MLGAATSLVLPWASPSQAAVFDPPPAGCTGQISHMVAFIPANRQNVVKHTQGIDVTLTSLMATPLSIQTRGFL